MQVPRYFLLCNILIVEQGHVKRTKNEKRDAQVFALVFPIPTHLTHYEMMLSN